MRRCTTPFVWMDLRHGLLKERSHSLLGLKPPQTSNVRSFRICHVHCRRDEQLVSCRWFVAHGVHPDTFPAEKNEYMEVSRQHHFRLLEVRTYMGKEEG